MLPPAPLTIPPGVVKGDTPAFSAGRYWNANQVRWRNGALTPLGGWNRVTGTALSSYGRVLLPWSDNTRVRHLAIASDSKLEVLTADTVDDITPTGLALPGSSFTETGYGTNTYGEEDYGEGRAIDGGSTLPSVVPYAFSLDAWGQNLVYVSSSDGQLFQWDPTDPLATEAALVADAPVSNRGVIVTSERHVILYGMEGYPKRFGWCSQEDIDDWDFGSTTNTAGFLELPSKGDIVGAVRVKEGVLLVTLADVWLVRYVGPPFVYVVEPIGETDGAVAPASLTSFGAGKAAWLGAQSFWVYDSGVVKPLPCDVGAWFFKDISHVYGPQRACGSDNGIFPEVWWHYPSTDATENDRYVIWNYEEGWWSIGAFPNGRTAMCPAGVFSHPYTMCTDKNLHQHEDGVYAAGASRAGEVWAETGVLGTGGMSAHLSQIQLDSGAEAAGSTITAYTRQTPDGAETTFGPYVPRLDGYTDTRIDGREMRLRFATGVDGTWTVGRMWLHSKARGRR